MIDLQGLFRTGFMSWASGAGVRLGLGSAREGARFFYTHKLITPDPDAHAVDRNFLVASCLGFGDVPIRFDLALSAAEREEAQRTCREAGLDSERPIVAVLPGARWETKLWPQERFAEAIDRLMIEDGVSCVLLGSTSEASLCANIASRCSADPVDLSGRTTLRQMAALLGMMDLVLCHDSAPMHVAVALERPIVCITGPTNPKRTGPYRRQEDVVRLELQCSPCYLRRLSQCPHRHRCMAELTTEEVLAASRRALSSASCSQF